MARLFVEPGNVDDFEIKRCQHIERLLTDGIGELFPIQPGTEEWSLNVDYLAHGHLLGREIPRAQKMPIGREDLQVLRLQPLGQPE